MTAFDDYGIHYFDGGVLLGSKRRYPTEQQFREAVRTHIAAYPGDSLIYLDTQPVASTNVRGCMCGYGAEMWAAPGKRFHWEISHDESHRGRIPCWQYGEFY